MICIQVDVMRSQSPAKGASEKYIEAASRVRELSNNC